MRKQFQHDLEGGKRFGSPVDRDEGKESVFDLVPFTGCRRILCHRDGELLFIDELLQLFLPESMFHAIGSTTISSDQESFFAGIERFPPLLPPSPDTFNRKFRRLMVNPDIDKPLMVNQVIDSVRNGFPVSQQEKIRHVHFR